MKRIFWLICAVVVSWLIWVRLRQRRDEFSASIPQFAPPRTFAPLTPPGIPTLRQAQGEPQGAAPSAPPPASDEEAAARLPAPPTSLPTSDEQSVPPPATPQLEEETTLTSASTDTPAYSADSAADVAEAVGSDEVEISGYCMRCKTKRPIQNAHRETTESGRPAARGTCPVCGANMFTFLSTDDS